MKFTWSQPNSVFIYLFIYWLLSRSTYYCFFSFCLFVSFSLLLFSIFVSTHSHVCNFIEPAKLFPFIPHVFINYWLSFFFSSCIAFRCSIWRIPVSCVACASVLISTNHIVQQFYTSFSCSWSTTVLTIGGSLWRGRGCLRSLWSWVSARCTQFRASTTSCGPQSWPTNAVTSARRGYHTMWPCPYPCFSVSTSSAESCFFTVNCSLTLRPGVLVLSIASTLTQDLCSRPSWQFALALYCWCLWFPCGSSPAGRWGNVKGKVTRVIPYIINNLTISILDTV